jgi:asparagine synthetase B (glutamine-hydrolysing)
MGSLAVFLARAPDAAAAGAAERVGRALAAAPHRGTDRRVLTRGRCALGVSSSEASDAWLADEDDLAGALSGVLDDQERLAKELALSGRPAAELQPASLLLAAWRAWGEGAPSRLRGVFAATVTDGTQVWAWRDHIGYRALFFRDDAAGTTVASEAKQVVAGAGIAREPDLDVLERVLFTDYGDETPAALRGVRRLPKATVLRAGDGSVATRRYWHPESLLETGRLTRDELGEAFEERFRQAVDRTLTGQDMVSLSGGIDSTAIAAFAAPLSRERFGRAPAALSAVFPDQPAVDETAYIALMAERFEMPLHTYERQLSPLDKLGQWTALFDGLVPILVTPDAEVNFETAREAGYRNILYGFAAELVFDMRGGLLAHLLAHGRLGSLAQHVRMRLAKGSPPLGVARQLVSAIVPGAAYRTYLNFRPPRRGARVPAWIDARKVNRRPIRESVAPAARWRHEQLGFQGPGLSVEAHEILQEWFGVRSRHPWVDIDLWELFLSLPAEQKFPDVRSKGLVRSLLRGHVPDEILDRKKKTVFNDSFTARIDYPELRRWLIDPAWRVPGVDYDTLREALDARTLRVFDYIWAKDLASVHAFLSSFDGST